MIEWAGRSVGPNRDVHSSPHCGLLSWRGEGTHSTRAGDAGPRLFSPSAQPCDRARRFASPVQAGTWAIAPFGPPSRAGKPSGGFAPGDGRCAGVRGLLRPVRNWSSVALRPVERWLLLRREDRGALRRPRDRLPQSLRSLPECAFPARLGPRRLRLSRTDRLLALGGPASLALSSVPLLRLAQGVTREWSTCPRRSALRGLACHPGSFRHGGG